MTTSIVIFIPIFGNQYSENLLLKSVIKEKLDAMNGIRSGMHKQRSVNATVPNHMWKCGGFWQQDWQLKLFLITSQWAKISRYVSDLKTTRMNGIVFIFLVENSVNGTDRRLHHINLSTMLAPYATSGEGKHIHSMLLAIVKAQQRAAEHHTAHSKSI